MATIQSGISRYSLKYKMATTGESSTRTIAGLNVRGGEDQTGLYPQTIVDIFYSTILSLSTAQIDSMRWINENEVTL